ncbi:MAG: RNase adapter RapZ [Myxococcales bacterium]|nr:RNase adapter RapZ [Myxococcales bacterium]
MRDTRLVIISGLSGSGKSIASKALEDLGYFCIDNLPVELLEKLIQLTTLGRPGDISRIAVVMDTRDPNFPGRAAETFQRLRDDAYHLEIVFLEADDRILIQRFSETRRSHPQASGGSVLEGIGKERESLSELKKSADWVVDTSALTPHELRSLIQERFAAGNLQPTMVMRLVSFGFKFGLPGDADLVMDVRFLPNPFFIEELRPFSGLDENVAKYVLENDISHSFLEKFFNLLSFLLPLYQREGKSYLTLAIGCTGGKHRSVAITENVARQLKHQGMIVTVQHRDVKK